MTEYLKEYKIQMLLHDLEQGCEAKVDGLEEIRHELWEVSSGLTDGDSYFGTTYDLGSLSEEQIKLWMNKFSLGSQYILGILQQLLDEKVEQNKEKGK